MPSTGFGKRVSRLSFHQQVGQEIELPVIQNASSGAQVRPPALLDHLPVNQPIQLVFDEVVNAGQFFCKPLHAESDEGGDIKGSPLSRLLKQALVLSFIPVEVVGQTVEAVDVVFALKQDASLQ